MNVRLTIALVVILAIVGGTVAVTQSLSTKERKPLPPWLFRVEATAVNAISVTHQGLRMEYAREGAQWVIKDGTDALVDAETWPGTPLVVSGVRCTRSLVDDPTDLARYGMDSPQTKVRIVDNHGTPLDYSFGDITPDGSSWYAMLEGSGRLCTVPSLWAEGVAELATNPPYALVTPVPTPQDGTTLSP